MEEKHTVCRLCSALCPVTVQLDKDRIISANRKTYPPIKYGLSCPKLRAATDILYSPDRIKAPLIKKGSGAKPEWMETTWEEAIDMLGEKLLSCKTEYGAQSVCWMRGMAADWGAPWDYAIRLMNTFGSPNVIGNGALCHVAREMAHVFTYGAMTSADYRHTGCLVIWGKNDRDTNPGAYDMILYAREQGAKLIVIDPIRTHLAAMADIWLQIKPGCDGLLAMSMIHVIISENLFDKGFVKTWTIGFDKLQEAARHYAPEVVAGEIWLKAEEIRQAARLYAGNRPACLMEGNGLDMHINVSQNTRAVCILRALTGNIDKKGGICFLNPYRRGI